MLSWMACAGSGKNLFMGSVEGKAALVTGVVHGHCASRFHAVAEALSEEISTGGELGAAIGIDIDGESVVDIWGGYADRAKTVEWGEDTIVNLFSSTKTVTALAALILVDRGQLDVFAPVAKYWPEFATAQRRRPPPRPRFPQPPRPTPADGQAGRRAAHPGCRRRRC
jgi:CubicO group peptidase (beta-lactamase class C family)